MNDRPTLDPSIPKLPDGVVAILRAELPRIDKQLVKGDIVVPERPMRAIFMFAEACLTIQNGAMQDFVRSIQFQQMVSEIVDWYYEKYGELARRRKDGLRGMATFRGEVAELNFPVTTSRVEEPGKTSWMKFPDHLEASEKLENYLDPKVGLALLTPEELDAFKANVARVIGDTRRGNLGLMTAGSISEEWRAMARTVFPHVSKGIGDVLAGGTQISVAQWEFHLAIEKSLKIFIAQFERPEAIHDLKALHQTAQRHGLVLQQYWSTGLIRPSKAIAGRYAQLKPSRKAAMTQYLQVIRQISEIATQLQREYSLWNSSLLLACPLWAR